jgi:hypothetical protein
MFDRFNALCPLQYTYYHPLSFLFFILFSILFLAPNPAYFCGLILPSVRSYRRFTQVLCPRSPLFLLYYSFIFTLHSRCSRDLMHCVLYNTLSFLFYSFSCTQSCLLLRSNFTFGTILPRIYASPVPAISTFFTFLFPYFYFTFLMFERFSFI